LAICALDSNVSRDYSEGAQPRADQDLLQFLDQERREDWDELPPLKGLEDLGGEAPGIEQRGGPRH